MVGSSSIPVSIYAEAIPMEKLVIQGIKQVPEAYIREYPSPVKADAPSQLQIPVINLSDDLPNGRSKMVLEIKEACENWGFFHVINHGIPGEVLDKMMQSTMGFFNLPFEEKMKLYSAYSPKGTRYSLRFDDLSVADWRDYLIFGSCFPATEQVMNMWPSNPPGFKDATRNYCDELQQLALKLLSLISESLGLRPDRLEEQTDENGLSVLCNRYMPCPQPELVLGARNHSDPNIITLLHENKIPGLEVLHENCWVPVHPLPNSLIVNVGDQLEIMSNGRYKSVEHRAMTNTDTTRVSIAGFFNPPFEAIVAPLPELVDEEHPPLYNGVSYHDFVEMFRRYSANSKASVTEVKAP